MVMKRGSRTRVEGCRRRERLPGRRVRVCCGSENREMNYDEGDDGCQ